MACNFIKKETLRQVFSCEYHKMFEKSFFKYGAYPVAASENGWRISKNFQFNVRNICTEVFIKEKDLWRRSVVNEDMK